MFIVIKNRYYPTSVRSLRESARRTIDRVGTASDLGELIDKHGREDWLDPLIDELGPYIQLQVGDIANMLEVFMKSASVPMNDDFFLTATIASTLGNHLERLPAPFCSF